MTTAGTQSDQQPGLYRCRIQPGFCVWRILRLPEARRGHRWLPVLDRTGEQWPAARHDKATGHGLFVHRRQRSINSDSRPSRRTIIRNAISRRNLLCRTARWLRWYGSAVPIVLFPLNQYHFDWSACGCAQLPHKMPVLCCAVGGKNTSPASGYCSGSHGHLMLLVPASLFGGLFCEASFRYLVRHCCAYARRWRQSVDFCPNGKRNARSIRRSADVIAR